MTAAHRHRAYTRLERDNEFRARLNTSGRHVYSYLFGTALDEHAWTQHQAQRRLIEVYP